MSEQQGGGLKEMRERISGYHVYDRHYEKVGKVDDLFVDHNDELEYIGLKMGGLLKSKTALIPMELVRINDRRDLIEIEADKKQIEDSPTFGKDEEITSEYEDKVHRHFGLQSPDASGERGSYGDYDAGEERREEGSRGSGEERDDDVDTEYGERAGSGDGSREPPRNEPRTEDRRGDDSSSRSEGSERDLSGAAAETGGREDSSSGSSGGARVRKRLRVPVQREEVHVDRVETDSGDDELRVRKEVVEGEETVDVPEGTVGPGEDTGRAR